jgi:hypothetical protein
LRPCFFVSFGSGEGHDMNSRAGDTKVAERECRMFISENGVYSPHTCSVNVTEH